MNTIYIYKKHTTSNKTLREKTTFYNEWTYMREYMLQFNTCTRNRSELVMTWWQIQQLLTEMLLYRWSKDIIKRHWNVCMSRTSKAMPCESKCKLENKLPFWMLCNNVLKASWQKFTDSETYYGWLVLWKVPIDVCINTARPSCVKAIKSITSQPSPNSRKTCS